MNQAVVITLIASVFVAIALPAWVLLSGGQSAARIKRLEQAVSDEKAQARAEAQAKAELKARTQAEALAHAKAKAQAQAQVRRAEQAKSPSVFGFHYKDAGLAAGGVSPSAFMTPSGKRFMAPTTKAVPTADQQLEALLGRSPVRPPEIKPARDEA